MPRFGKSAALKPETRGYKLWRAPFQPRRHFSRIIYKNRLSIPKLVLTLVPDDYPGPKLCNCRTEGNHLAVELDRDKKLSLIREIRFLDDAAPTLAATVNLDPGSEVVDVADGNKRKKKEEDIPEPQFLPEMPQKRFWTLYTPWVEWPTGLGQLFVATCAGPCTTSLWWRAALICKITLKNTLPVSDQIRLQTDIKKNGIKIQTWHVLGE